MHNQPSQCSTANEDACRHQPFYHMHSIAHSIIQAQHLLLLLQHSGSLN
jgi:hypothetical protein